MQNQTQIQEQLTALATHLEARQTAILEAWRSAIESDPDLTTGSEISRTLFFDHVPEILNSFTRRLRAWPSEISFKIQQQEVSNMKAHGLHRWQQGFRLREVTREWGYLQLCLAEEIDVYTTDNSLNPKTATTALRALTLLCVAGVGDSTERFWQLHQTEAASHLRDLQSALAAVNEIETARAAGWHQAAHDLRGGLTAVQVASTILSDDATPDAARVRSSALLQQSVESLHEMLTNLVDLARLESGQEKRTVAPFDAAKMLNSFCEAMEPLARQANLTLECEGPHSLVVEGDAIKVRRIVQNLVLNALKYTHEGGVVVRCEPSSETDVCRWMITVQDTGPGFDDGCAPPIVEQLQIATQEAEETQREARAEGTATNWDAPAQTLPSQSPDTPFRQQAGEGIGLSIVKGLCEVLDASLELESGKGRGSTFRVTFPVKYQ